MAKKSDYNSMFMFILLGIVVVLLLHYFVILRFNLYPTLQVFISIILFWIWLIIIYAISPKKR